MKIGVIVGSLRKESLNRKVAKALIALAPRSLEITLIDIGDLSLFNDDLDQGLPPESWRRFRAALEPLDGVIFVTPEYNRSVPAVLKNAVDIGSRPSGKNAWSGKAGAVISASPGAAGAFGANQHLRQSLSAVNIAVMPQPEVYLGHAQDLFDSSGALINEKTRVFLSKFMEAYSNWVLKIRGRA